MVKCVLGTLLVVFGLVGNAQAQSYYTVNFQAQSGHYVVAEGNGGTWMNADRGSAGSWETFTLIDANGGSLDSGDEVYIQTGGGYFASQQCTGSFYAGMRMQAFTTSQNCASIAYIDKYDSSNNLQSGPIYSGDQVAIVQWHGYWQAAGGGGGQLLVTLNSVGAWEKFFITY
jgi:hypothetical protein